MTEHDRRRLRTTRRIALAGPAIGILAAGLAAILGGSGRFGSLMMLVCCAGGTTAAALVTLVQAAVDEARREPVALRRVGWALLLILVTLVLIVFVAGILAGADA